MKTIHRNIQGLIVLLSGRSSPSPSLWPGEETVPPGAGSQIPPTDWGLQIWTLVAFLVLLVLLAKFAFKPLAEALDRRSEAIKKSFEEAQKQRAEAKKLMEDYQKQLAEARSEANKIIEEARGLGENVRKEVVEKATAEAALCSSAHRRKSSAKRRRASRSSKTPLRISPCRLHPRSSRKRSTKRRIAS